MQKQIVMIGTSLETKGGIASVVKVYQDAGLFNKFPINYLASHCDGGILKKMQIFLVTYLQFLALLAIGRIVALHLHTASRASFWRKFFFVVPSFLFNVPFVLHLHGAEFREFYGQESSPLSQKVIAWVFQNATCVIALSESWRQWIKEQFPLSRVVAIYNPTVVSHNGDAIRQDSQDTPNILFLGRLGVRKGVFDLLDAVALIEKEIPAVKLLLAGDGDLQAVAERASVLGITENVELLGWIDSKRKHDLLRCTSIFVLPSYNEGLPMGVLEAMAAGVPVVASPVGGIPEAVEEGVHGFLVEPGNVDLLAERLAQLLRDPALRRLMGMAGRAKADSVFSAERIVEQIGTVYDGIRGIGKNHDSRS